VKPNSPNAPSTWLIFLCPHTHPYPQTCQYSFSSILAVRISCRIIAVFVFRKPLFTLIMDPKRKSSDGGSASKPQRSRDIFSISEKVNILDMIELEKNGRRRLPGCTARTNLPFVKWWKKRASFSVAPQTANITAIARDKVLMKIEKALNFWVEKHDFNCLCSALMEQHNFYCFFIPWNCTWYCTVHVRYFFIAVSSLED
jgi:hypothetical protein